MQSYNNRYGYKTGDKLLCLTAKTLKEFFPNALIARGPDDHFIMITSSDYLTELEKRIYVLNKKIRKNAEGNTLAYARAFTRFQTRKQSL